MTTDDDRLALATTLRAVDIRTDDDGNIAVTAGEALVTDDGLEFTFKGGDAVSVWYCLAAHPTEIAYGTRPVRCARRPGHEGPHRSSGGLEWAEEEADD